MQANWLPLVGTIFVTFNYCLGVTAHEAKPRGADSPGDAFHEFKAAVVGDDWKHAYQLLADDSQQILVGSLLAGSHAGLLGDEGKKLAAESADSDKVKKIVERLEKASHEEQERLVKTLAQSVGNPPLFISKALKVCEKRQQENWLNSLENSTLQNLKVNGESAEATMKCVYPRPGVPGAGYEPIGFVKIRGKWLVQLRR